MLESCCYPDMITNSLENDIFCHMAHGHSSMILLINKIDCGKKHVLYHCVAWLFLTKNSLMAIIIVAMLIWFKTYISRCIEDNSLRHMSWGICMAPSSLFGDAWSTYNFSWGFTLFNTWSKHVEYKLVLVLFVKLKRDKKKVYKRQCSITIKSTYITYYIHSRTTCPKSDLTSPLFQIPIPCHPRSEPIGFFTCLWYQENKKQMLHYFVFNYKSRLHLK